MSSGSTVKTTELSQNNKLNELGNGALIYDKTKDKTYTILHIKQDYAVVCETYSPKIVLEVKNFTEIKNSIMEGDCISIQQKKKVFDIDALPDEEKQHFKNRKEFIERIEDIYGPDFLDLTNRKPKVIITEYMLKFNVTRATLWRYIRLYLQSGRDIYSMIDSRFFKEKYKGKPYSYQKKTGRKYDDEVDIGIPLDDFVIASFEDGVKYYLGGKSRSLINAYEYLTNKHFSVISEENGKFNVQWLPRSERPTIRQFYYYCQKRISERERAIARTSYMEYRNNMRLLLSDTIKDAHGPADLCMMDEVEFDISLRSSVVEGQVIGRPIVYCITDCYTGLIMAIGIGIENNSIVGMTNCLLNLVEDKQKYCDKYGIKIKTEQWPCMDIMPRRVLVDRGAEYTSHEAERIFTELGINLEHVPAGTGSLKSTQERGFGVMQGNFRAYFEKYGLITKRHDSNHHKEATLTIDVFEKAILNYVIYHNCQPNLNYPKTKDMIRSNINAVPVVLWKYGIDKYGSPLRISNKLQFYWSLLKPMKGNLSRKGLQVNGLNYVNLNDKQFLEDMANAGGKAVGFGVRIDVRDVGCVYYLRDNQMRIAKLNSAKTGNADFIGMSLNEWQVIRKHLSKMKRDERITKEEEKAYLGRITDILVQSAAQMAEIPVTTNNMREFRRLEKSVTNTKYSIFIKVCDFLESELNESVDMEGLDKGFENIEEIEGVVEGNETKSTDIVKTDWKEEYDEDYFT